MFRLYSKGEEEKGVCANDEAARAEWKPAGSMRAISFGVLLSLGHSRPLPHRNLCTAM